jgi:type I restriction enzyme, S subunit
MKSLMSIADLFDLKKGKKPGELFDICPDNGKPFLQIDHLRGQGKNIFTVDDRATEVNASDICIVWDGANAGLVGYGLEGNIGSTITRLRPKEIDRIHVPFVAKYLQSKFSYINKSAQGAAIPHVDGYKLKNLTLFLPSKTEQERIAAILDKADAVRRKRQQAIELSEQLLRSVFLDMFGDPSINSKGLELVNISDIGTIITGNTPSRKKVQYYGSAIEWIKSDNINTPFHYLTEAEEYLSIEGKRVGRCAPKNSILITCIAGSKNCIGNIAMTDREVAFNQQINAIIPNEKILLYFLYAQLLFNKEIIQNASTNSMKGMVSKSRLSNIKILCPPITEQEKYSQFFSRAVNKLQKDNLSYIELNKLFNVLAQKAFGGALSRQSETELTERIE